MFKKTEKMKRVDFDALLKSGKRIQNSIVSIVFQGAETTKTAVVVSKKVSKGAVQRNLLKRRVFSILKKNRNLFEEKHIAVFVKKTATQGTYQELEKGLVDVLTQIKNGKTHVNEVE